MCIKNKNNPIWEFFRPTKWKVIFAIGVTIISFFVIGVSYQDFYFSDFNGGLIFGNTYSLLKIINPYLFLVLVFILSYLLFSLIKLIVGRLKNE